MPAPREGGGTLPDVMRFLADAFRRPEPVADDEALAARARLLVTGNDRLTPPQQVDIYRRQYWLRHVDSLGEDYPGLGELLGEDGFDAFARAYLRAHPPRHASLRDLGCDLVPFAKDYAFPDAWPREVYLDMLRYENAFIELFDGAPAPRLLASKIQSLDASAWETARILLDPLIVRMRLSSTVHLRRRDVVLGRELAPIERRDVPIVLFRDDTMICFEELEPTAYDLLAELAAGTPLVPACDRIAQKLDEPGQVRLQADVGAWFQKWTGWGWIVDVAAAG